MNSVQINIEANEERQEILISLLSDLDAEGFEQTDKNLVAYFNENTFKKDEVDQILNGCSFNIKTIEEQNWNEVWENNFQPVVVNGFCAIRAEFHEPVKGVEHEIIITPKTSFGTGHHATTHMMIEQMQGIDFKNKTVLDFGTGTGILAILAERLGARAVSAIDADNWSIENAKENNAANGCSKISVEQSAKIPEQKFDIILANINRNVILEYLPLLKNTLNEKGYLLLSGFITSDENDIVTICQKQNLYFVKKIERNNWLSLLFQLK